MKGSPLAERLSELYDAERRARRAHAELASADPKTLLAVLRDATHDTLEREDLEDEERVLRLVRLAGLLGELEGEGSVDLLIDILGSDEPEARHAAGEALEDMAYDRFKEVALGVERALDRLKEGNVALAELPFLLCDIPEPGVLKLLARFLGRKDPETVAAAIEALAEFGHPSAIEMLVPYQTDSREVTLEDDEGEEDRVTIGDLASDARELLKSLEDRQSAGRIKGGAERR